MQRVWDTLNQFKSIILKLTQFKSVVKRGLDYVLSIKISKFIYSIPGHCICHYSLYLEKEITKEIENIDT